jgi:hypothetical protein
MSYGAVPVVIELHPQARSLVGFTHLPAACYIFGPEDGNASASILARAATSAARARTASRSSGASTSGRPTSTS